MDVCMCGSTPKKGDLFCRICGREFPESDSFLCECGADVDFEDNYCHTCGVKFEGIEEEDNTKKISDNDNEKCGTCGNNL